MVKSVRHTRDAGLHFQTRSERAHGILGNHSEEPVWLVCSSSVRSLSLSVSASLRWADGRLPGRVAVDGLGWRGEGGAVLADAALPRPALA